MDLLAAASGAGHGVVSAHPAAAAHPRRFGMGALRALVSDASVRPMTYSDLVRLPYEALAEAVAFFVLAALATWAAWRLCRALGITWRDALDELRG